MEVRRFGVMRSGQILSDHATEAEAEAERRRVYGDRVAALWTCNLCGADVPLDERCGCERW